MEYCKGGDLFDYLSERSFQISEERAAKLIFQLSSAINFIHSYGIVHRDLKPENILMTDKSDTSNIKLLDFGLSKILGPGEKCNDFVGTLVSLSFYFRHMFHLKSYLSCLMIRK